MQNEAEQRIGQVRNGETIQFVFEYETKSKREAQNVDCQFVVLKQSGEQVVQFGARFTGQSFKRIPSNGKIACKIKKFPLVPGRYRLNVYLV